MDNALLKPTTIEQQLQPLILLNPFRSTENSYEGAFLSLVNNLIINPTPEKWEELQHFFAAMQNGLNLGSEQEQKEALGKLFMDQALPEYFFESNAPEPLPPAETSTKPTPLPNKAEVHRLLLKSVQKPPTEIIKPKHLGKIEAAQNLGRDVGSLINSRDILSHPDFPSEYFGAGYSASLRRAAFEVSFQQMDRVYVAERIVDESLPGLDSIDLSSPQALAQSVGWMLMRAYTNGQTNWDFVRVILLHAGMYAQLVESSADVYRITNILQTKYPQQLLSA